jgi:hypothetical protein
VEIVPCWNRLSVTVGTVEVLLTVPEREADSEPLGCHTIMKDRQTLSQINRSNSSEDQKMSRMKETSSVPKNAIGVIKALSAAGDTDRLVLDDEFGRKSNGI